MLSKLDYDLRGETTHNNNKKQRKVRTRVDQSQILLQLENASREEWNNISQRNIQNLFGSMRRWLRAVNWFERREYTLLMLWLIWFLFEYFSLILIFIMMHKKPNYHVSQFIFTTISVTFVLQHFSRGDRTFARGYILHTSVNLHDILNLPDLV